MLAPAEHSPLRSRPPTYADLCRSRMNKVFKKKVADGGGGAPAVTTTTAGYGMVAPAQVSPGIKKASTSRWKKGKKVVEEKPAFDLSSALPSTDDFRTSLLMPNLSKRFSMLREQDDPSSLLGKASDDSVLQPRRRSRLNDFSGFGGLGDIDEVDSIRGGFRPPFAGGRTGSYASEEGYGSDTNTGSVMTRARPGEGNILFGGRQKIYRIANGANGSSRSLGKAVYEDDIGVSAFQRYRQRERERDESQFSRPSDDSQGFDFGLDHPALADHDDNASYTHNDSAKDLSHSPPLSSYDKKRSTTSSTARSEARSSTAATSVASQPAASPAVSAAPGPGTAPHLVPGLERSNTKSRRLYDQGLDQHMREEQVHAMSRLNSIARQRGGTGGKASPPFLHGARSMGNLHERSAQPVYTTRTQSPPLTGPLASVAGMHRNASGTPSPSAGSPIDPQMDPQYELQQALDPNDRGKATAMGAFNKPKQAFDEQQYLERQKQLQRSASNAVTKPATQPPQRFGRFEAERERSGSDASARSTSQSNQKKPDLKSYNVFQMAASQLQAQNMSHAPKPNKSPLPDTHRTFFGNIHASDSEDDDDSSANHFDAGSGYPSKWQPAMPSVSEHPALRGQKSKMSLREEHEFAEPDARPEVPPLNYGRHNSESPAPATTSQPLGSMVSHLRSKSNASSMYPGDESVNNDDHDAPDVPDVPRDSMPKLAIGKFGFEDTAESIHSGSNPWDLESEHRSSTLTREESQASVSPIEPTAALNISRSRSPISPMGGDPPAPVFPAFTTTQSSNTPTPSEEAPPSWQQELRRNHQRDVSSATQQERDAFASELAARRNAIRENIKSIVENVPSTSRDSSPAPTPSTGQGPFKAFGMLRSKASGESMANLRERDQQLKSVKSSSSMNGDGSRSRGNSSPRPPLPNTNHPAFAGYSNSPAARDRSASRNGYPRGDDRSRSNSVATTGRSRSRTGRYRDDSDRTMGEHGLPDVSPLHIRELTPASDHGSGGRRPSDDHARGAVSGLSNYFDAKTAQAAMHRGPISPSTPSMPLGYNPVRPSPVNMSMAAAATPPLSGATTPILGAGVGGISSGVGVPAYMPPVVVRSRSNTLRKKTISKADISEPTLITATSNIDTVELADASLRTGAGAPVHAEGASAPPIPPINPKRRGTRTKLFAGIGGRSSDGEVFDPAGGSSRSKTPDAEYGQYPSSATSSGRAPPLPSSTTARERSNGSGEYPPDSSSNPYGYGAPSPERERERVPVAGMEGAMF